MGRTPADVLGPLGTEVGNLLDQVLARPPVIDVELTGETPAAPGVTRTGWRASTPCRARTASSPASAPSCSRPPPSASAPATRSASGARRPRCSTPSSPRPPWGWPLRPGGRYRRVNRALAEWNRLPIEAHLGRTPGEVLGDAGRGPHEAVREVLRTGRAGRRPRDRGPGEWGAGGTFRQGTVVPRHVAGGEIIGVAGGDPRRDRAARGGGRADAAAASEALTSRAQAEAAQVRAEAAHADAEAARRRTEFLAGAAAPGRVTTDYERTLQEVARVAGPMVADWCAITVVPHGRGA